LPVDLGGVRGLRGGFATRLERERVPQTAAARGALAENLAIAAFSASTSHRLDGCSAGHESTVDD
jgi:hypothetical protein